MKDIEWKEEFPGLPVIPVAKRWLAVGEPGTATREQIISHKLHFHHPISKDETQEMVECIKYYNDLGWALKTFDFSKIAEKDVQPFLRYIDYAFTYVWLHSNEIELYETYRLVLNSDKKTKENVSQVSFPPLEKVKKKNLYNRGNSPNSTVFYCSEYVDTAFKELKAGIGSVVTLGIWRPKENNKFLSYQISSNPSAQMINDIAKTSKYAVNVIKTRFHPLFGMFMDGYFNVLDHEYSKPINNKLEYLISAHFSERIFELREKEWTYDCIIYPSVGDNFANSNLAFRADTVINKLKLVKAFEYEILQTSYEKKACTSEPRTLTVAEVRVRNMSKKITPEGEIEWVN